MDLHFTGEWSWWLGLGAALALAYAAWRLYRRETRPLGGKKAWLLPLLRTIAVFLLVMMLTEPVLNYRKFVGQLARIVLLVNGSESMSLTDEQMDPARKILVARVPTLANPRQFDKFPEQKSSPIPLTAGQKYAIEALHKEGTAGDHLCVAWQLPDGTVQCPIPGNALSPSVAPSALGKDHLASLVNRLNGELLAPSRQLAQRKDDLARLLGDLRNFNAVLLRWEQELRAAFSDYAGRLVAAGDEGIRPVIERFDSMPRWRRAEMILLGGKEKLLAQVASKHNAELDVGIEKKIQYLWGMRSGQAPENLPMESAGKGRRAAARPGGRGREGPRDRFHRGPGARRDRPQGRHARRAEGAGRVGLQGRPAPPGRAKLRRPVPARRGSRPPARPARAHEPRTGGGARDRHLAKRLVVRGGDHPADRRVDSSQTRRYDLKGYERVSQDGHGSAGVRHERSANLGLKLYEPPPSRLVQFGNGAKTRRR